MDHSPGQGQYQDLAIYRETLAKYQGCESEEYDFEAFIAREKTKEVLSFEQLRELSRMAHEHGIAVASHDDDTARKAANSTGKSAWTSANSPSPSRRRATHARSGFATVVGAPNILRGGSHSGNMSAAEAIQAGCADILCSDYYPPAILHGVFIMHEKYGLPLPAMVNKASLNPAKAVGLGGQYGSIEPGKKADLLIIELLDGYPVITHVLVDGRTTSRVEYRR